MLILGIGLFIFVLADVQVISTNRPGIDPPGGVGVSTPQLGSRPKLGLWNK